jgi:nitrate/nitrite transporter NarK
MSASRRIGAVLALVGAIGAIGSGVCRGLPPLETFWRAALSAVVGCLLGWLVFGKLGAWIVREAAGRKAEAGPAEVKARARPPAGT